jgi:hypothetical protein
MFQKLIKNNTLKNSFKLIGIGAGNSAFEVDVFRKKYDIQFPLFPDPDYIIHKKIGEVRTPYFFGVRVEGNKSQQVIYSKLGGFKNDEKFIDTIVKAAKLK